MAREPPLERAARYQQRAQECRALGAAASTPEERERWLGVADAYVALVRLILADPPVVGGTEQLAGDGADHAVKSSMPAAGGNPPGAREMRHFSGNCNGITGIEQDRAASET